MTVQDALIYTREKMLDIAANDEAMHPIDFGNFQDTLYDRIDDVRDRYENEKEQAVFAFFESNGHSHYFAMRKD